MQGKKLLQPKLFNSFNLSERIPEDNFYRRLKGVLDLKCMYQETKAYYGSCGQKSLDPTVFFRLCLVGYLENIISDRQLIQHASMRLDILYFIDYDIDDELPWHSTMSRTRELFPDKVFDHLFEKVLVMCVEKGMVSGKTQAIDSAPVKASAGMESLELKVPEEELYDHLRKVRAMSQSDKKAKKNKASIGQQVIDATEGELKALDSRTKNWSSKQENKPGAKSKGAKYTSNKTHYSPSDRNVGPAGCEDKCEAWQSKKAELSCTDGSRYEGHPRGRGGRHHQGQHRVVGRVLGAKTVVTHGLSPLGFLGHALQVAGVEVV